MRILYKALAAVAFTALAACSTYREYVQEPCPLVDSLYGFQVADTSCMASMSWQDFFKDANLRRLIQDGLDNNADVRIASLKICEAEALLDAAEKAFLPGASLSPSASWSVPGKDFKISNVLQASWEADLSGKLLNRKRISRTAYEQAQVYEASVRTELVSAIALCYYNLLKLDAQLEISRSTADSWKQNVRIMRSMKEAGMTNEASVSQTEANACSVEASLYDLEYQIKAAENALCLLAGTTPGPVARGRLADVSFPDELLCGVPARLLSNRPDVKHAELAVRKSYYATQEARAAFYPSVTISATACPIPELWFFSIGAQLVQPIFAKGQLKANLTVAQASQQEAAESFRKALLTAGSEVSDALALCESAKAKTDVRSRQISALESAVNSTRQLMRHSESTYLEVLTAQQSLLSAQLLQISDRYDAIQGVVSLYKALGGGY